MKLRQHLATGSLPSPLLQLAEQLLANPRQAKKLVEQHPKIQLSKSLDHLLRAGHQIHFIHYRNKMYIFKVFADLGNHSWGRRLEFHLHNTLLRLALKSYRGALRLQQIGVPAIQPLACIEQERTLSPCGLFIYSGIQAEQSLGRWLRKQKEPERKRQALELLSSISRTLEASDFYFDDFKLNNILVEENTATGELRLVLIDTDAVPRSRFKHCRLLPSPIREWIKLRHLKRIKPDPPLDQEFLKLHLQEDYTASAFETWKRLQKSQVNPWKKIKRKIKSR